MPKTIVIGMNEQYPFLASRANYLTSNAQILVGKIEKITEANQASIKGKATVLKNLRNKNLIKVQNLVEQDTNIQIFYENVESKFTWNDPQIINEVYSQLKNLTTYLSNIGIKAPLKSSRIGVNDKQVLKYYLGIDFDWDSQNDDEFLQNYYQGQLKKLFGHEFMANSSLGNQSALGRKSPSINEKPVIKNSPQRKISIATVSSRQNRIANIEKQMNLIKSSFQKSSPMRKESNAGIDQSKICNFSSIGSAQASQRQIYSPAQLLRNKEKLAKKFEDRKFSGDIKNNIMSTKKLEEKQSDIKSQRGIYPTNRLRERYLRQNNVQEIETIKSKTKMEEMKYQQYIQITKSQKNYLQDFISVLEDENPLISYTASPNTSSKATRPTQNSSKIEDTISLTAEALRLKTQQAIFNSRKIINKVKGFPAKPSMQD